MFGGTGVCVWGAALLLPPGARFHAPVARVDLFATAAATAGAPLPADRAIDGVGLVRLARGEGQGRPNGAIFWRSGHYRTILADDWKLQVSGRPPRQWLFDMNADPTERTNLVEIPEPARPGEEFVYWAN